MKLKDTFLDFLRSLPCRRDFLDSSFSSLSELTSSVWCRFLCFFSLSLSRFFSSLWVWSSLKSILSMSTSSFFCLSFPFSFSLSRSLSFSFSLSLFSLSFFFSFSSLSFSFLAYKGRKEMQNRINSCRIQIKMRSEI